MTPFDIDEFGFITVTVWAPVDAMSVAETCAVSEVVDRNVVVSKEPSHSTVDPLTNPLPVTARVNAELPSAAVDGFKLAIAGGVCVALTVKLALPESVPSGLLTVIVATPVVDSKLAGIVAVSCSPETYAVASCVPFHSTSESGRKFAPFTVSVVAGLPGAALVGLKDAIEGNEGGPPATFERSAIKLLPVMLPRPVAVS